MRTLKLTLAYVGTAYHGWQVQPDRPTVQLRLEEALRTITGESIRTLASGRTDAGVHALGQVVGFRTECQLAPDVLVRALNANLPEDIVVLDIIEAPHRFHPIGDSIQKRYRYLLHDGPIRPLFLRNHCWHVRRPLNVNAMADAAKFFLGTHDFCSFETTGAPRESTVRTVSDVVVRRGWFEDTTSDRPLFGPLDEKNLIVFEVEADGFLYNMVRAMVGTLVEVGRSAQTSDWVERVIEATDRAQAGPTAPALGLFLVKVDYPF